MFMTLLRNKGVRSKVLACLLLGISFTCRVSSHGIFIVLFLMLFKYGSGAWIFDKAEDAKYKPEPSIPRVIWPDGNTDVLHVVLLIFNDKFSSSNDLCDSFQSKARQLRQFRRELDVD